MSQLLCNHSKVYNFCYCPGLKNKLNITAVIAGEVMIKSALRNVGVAQGLKVKSAWKVIVNFAIQGTLNSSRNVLSDKSQKPDFLNFSSSTEILCIVSECKQKTWCPTDWNDGAFSATSQDDQRRWPHNCSCFRKGRRWQDDDSNQLGSLLVDWRKKCWNSRRWHLWTNRSTHDEHQGNPADWWKQHDNSAGQLRHQMLVNGTACWGFECCYLARASRHVSSTTSAERSYLGKFSCLNQFEAYKKNIFPGSLGYFDCRYSTWYWRCSSLALTECSFIWCYSCQHPTDCRTECDEARRGHVQNSEGSDHWNRREHELRDLWGLRA